MLNQQARSFWQRLWHSCIKTRRSFCDGESSFCVDTGCNQWIVLSHNLRHIPVYICTWESLSKLKLSCCTFILRNSPVCLKFKISKCNSQFCCCRSSILFKVMACTAACRLQLLSCPAPHCVNAVVQLVVNHSVLQCTVVTPAQLVNRHALQCTVVNIVQFVNRQRI